MSRMTNNTLSQLSREAFVILLKARQLEKWVSMEHLVPFGMHRILLYELEDMGMVIVNSHNNIPMIKLTLHGINTVKELF